MMIFASALPGAVRQGVSRLINATAPIFLLLLSGVALAAPPTVTAPTGNQTYAQGENVNLDAGAAFSDPDGDTLSYSASGLPASLSINNGSGVITGTLTNNDWLNGPVYNVAVTANDGNGGTVDDNFSINVNNLNDAPTVTAPTGNQNLLEGDAVNLDAAAAFTDIDGDN